MEVFGTCWSDIGRREVNQDAILYRDYEQNGQHFAICAVCDGIGGLEHGEKASSYLVRHIEEWYSFVSTWLDIACQDSRVLFSHLKDAAEFWNEGVLALCREEGIHTGSTMSIWMLLRDSYYIIHVGDSRIYRFLNGLDQLTTDATVVHMKEGRKKRYLNNFMGKTEELTFQVAEGRLCGQELFLVCSDGGYHFLTEQDALDVCRRFDKAKSDCLCRNLVETMITRGEKDNVSIGMIKIG